MAGSMKIRWDLAKERERKGKNILKTKYFGQRKPALPGSLTKLVADKMKRDAADPASRKKALIKRLLNGAKTGKRVVKMPTFNLKDD